MSHSFRHIFTILCNPKPIINSQDVGAMHTLFSTLLMIASLKWGDWKNFRQYYPTFLFFIVGDLSYQYLLYNKSMWQFHPILVDTFILPNHTIISFSKMILVYGATLSIFLGHFPQRRKKQITWILLWVLVYSLFETVNLSIGGISHHNGWSLGWSLYFNILMFSVLGIHHFRPILAWILSGINILFLWHMFDLSITIFK